MAVKKQTIEVLRGLPASGKSTYAIEKCEKNKQWFRVSRDAIRRMRGQYWLPKDEELISQIEKASVYVALSAGKNVIIDATNLNPKYRGWIEGAAEEHDCELVITNFDTPVNECIKRDLVRANSVGEKVIRRMWHQYIVGEIKAPEHNSALPNAVIFDIDGTLAHMVDRSPYDYSKVSTDSRDECIYHLRGLYKSHGSRIIIMTGRDGVCKKETLAWLDKHDIHHDLFLQREEGDTRDDSLIKRELYENEIRGKYNVLCVFDDRNRVVDMWRQLGIKCLQVADGAF